MSPDDSYPCEAMMRSGRRCRRRWRYTRWGHPVCPAHRRLDADARWAVPRPGDEIPDLDRLRVHVERLTRRVAELTAELARRRPRGTG